MVYRICRCELIASVVYRVLSVGDDLEKNRRETGVCILRAMIQHAMEGGTPCYTHARFGRVVNEWLI
jgi:hypothetical protein